MEILIIHESEVIIYFIKLVYIALNNLSENTLLDLKLTPPNFTSFLGHKGRKDFLVIFFFLSFL